MLDAEAPAFQSVRRYTAAELSEFEERAGVQCPQSYRHFLQRVGACRCYWENGVGVEFLALDQVAAFTAQVCGKGVRPLPALWLVASSSFGGELAGFDLGRKNAVNFAVFLPDVPPEHWLTDTDDWLTFENWLTVWVASGGEEFLQ